MNRRPRKSTRTYTRLPITTPVRSPSPATADNSGYARAGPPLWGSRSSTLTVFILAVFVATYAGMALDRVPGLKVDRTGIALMAVALLLAGGAVSVEGVGRAVDKIGRASCRERVCQYV